MVRDLRKYTKQTNQRIVIGVIALILIVGNGLIYFIYGTGASLLGFICMLSMGVPLLLIIGYLSLMEWIAKKAHEE